MYNNCGIGVGAEVDLMAFFVGRYFGLRAYGRIYGVMFAAFAGDRGPDAVGELARKACWDGLLPDQLKPRANLHSAARSARSLNRSH